MSFDALELSVLQSLRGARQQVVLAVSGGVDSMVLMHAAARVASATIGAVATFDHGTGDAARRAAALVVAQATRSGLRVVGARALGQPKGEAAWRAARWNFLNTIARDCGEENLPLPVATAHTLDDHLETVVMRTLRHSGARGLAAMYAGSEIIRPLLAHTRADVLRYAAEHSVEFVVDPSNASLRYLRNRVRLEILPVLRAVDPSFGEYMLQLSRRAASWRVEVDALVRELAAGRGSGRSTFRVGQLAGLSEQETAVVAQAIAARAGVRLDRRGTLRLASFLTQNRIRGRAQLSGAHEVERIGDTVHFRNVSPPATAAPTVLAEEARCGVFRFKLATAGARNRGAWAARLPESEVLTVRAWLPGDRITAAGSARPRRVKRFRTEAGIAGTDRPGWPVVRSGETILWIPGVVRSSLVQPFQDSHPSENDGGNTIPGVAYICERVDPPPARAFR
jgi:tRNA(Ile)-lysidine synthase